jgi:hypothetical protein
MIYTAWELSKYDLVHELSAALQSDQFLDQRVDREEWLISSLHIKFDV